MLIEIQAYLRLYKLIAHLQLVVFEYHKTWVNEFVWFLR